MNLCIIFGSLRTFLGFVYRTFPLHNRISIKYFFSWASVYSGLECFHEASFGSVHESINFRVYFYINKPMRSLKNPLWLKKKVYIWKKWSCTVFHFFICIHMVESSFISIPIIEKFFQNEKLGKQCIGNAKYGDFHQYKYLVN